MGRSVYATIQNLRDAGLSDTTTYPDTTLTDLLELASSLVEAATRQVFGPVRKTFRANGLSRRIVEEEDRNRIIEIESVQVLRSGLLRQLGFLSDTPTVLDSNDFTVQPRFIRLRPRDITASRFIRSFQDLREIRFPHDDQNVEVTGVFGWLDLADKHETTLSSALARGATSVSLDDVGDVEKDDLLLVDGKFWVIATADPSGGSVSIDPSPKAAASGDSAVRYGKVPRLVRQATIRTAVVNRFSPASDDEVDLRADGRIRREETDNYEIEFFAPPGSDRVNSGTGDPVADALLSNFRAPTVAARWV